MPATGNGSAVLREIAVRLRSAGERIPVDFTRAIREGADPLRQAATAAALDKLPKTGGLNEYVARQRITISVRTGARTAGVRLFTRDPATRQTDRGWVRHPRFGHRGPGDWYSEAIPQAAGWWTDTMREKSPTVTPHILAEMHRMLAYIQGRG
jgi:hypothetical protein